MTDHRTVAVSGASGLVGRALLPALRAAGWRVRPLVRRAPQGDEVRWDPAGPWDPAPLDGTEAIVHLAGEGIAEGRWSAARKAAIRESRVAGTHSLVERLATLARPPRTLLAASAMGIYGDRGDELLPESAHLGRDFLAEVALGWEAEAEGASRFGARVAPLRFGILLSPDGGALGKMLLPFRLGLGGRMGSGRQWMSWIALEDLVRVVLVALDDPRYTGPVNCCTPTPVTNAEFTRTLGRVLHRPTWLPVPTTGLKLLFGEMASGTILASQRLVPARLQELRFEWHHPTLEGALRHLLGKG